MPSQRTHRRRIGAGRSFKRKRSSQSASDHAGLEEKVAESGGRLGYGLENSSDVELDDAEIAAIHKEGAGVYGGRSVTSSSNNKVPPRVRLFQQPSKTSDGAQSVTSNKSKNPYANNRGKKASRRSGLSSESSVSTPTTARAPTVRSGAVHIVCAISENLAKETCVASLDAGSPVSIQVTKQGNGQTYAETIAYLEVLQPDEVLLNEGRRNSQLAAKVLSLYNQPQSTENPIDVERNRRVGGRKSRHFPTARTASSDPSKRNNEDELLQVGLSGPCTTSTVVKFVPRAYFDQTKGAELLQRIARSDTYDPSLVEEYILLSSAHATLLYTQLCLGANFARNSLHLNINAGGNNRMNIDRSSLLHLELLANAKTGKMANSLIGTIDCTKTTVGSRLLRTNLMAPPMRVDTINTRLDLVDALLADEDFFYTIMEHLEALPDVDKMLVNVALVPWKRGTKGSESAVTARVASKGISALVCIKSILGAMPAFAGALQDQLAKIEARERNQSRTSNHARSRGQANDNMSVVTENSLLVGLGSKNASFLPHMALRNQLLRAILMTMKHPALPVILNAVLDIFTESTTFSRNAHAMRHQECFALKPKTDGMMDVIRKAFLANVDDIYRLADKYAEEFGIKVAVKETSSRGYYLAIPEEVAADLPQVFIQPVKSGRYIYCTTEEVHSLNARAQENVQDLLLMTHEQIQDVLDVARSQYDVLASLCDAIALLDLCHCFADNVASSRAPWCRPVVSDDSGELSIRNGRYGIDTSKAGLSIQAESFIPNDSYASRSRYFTVITGVNGSGKSTYLKQLAILVVLAHCGSYVPADGASIPIRDRVCTRIGTADDQEHNISTFMLEMKEAAFISKHATERSLILIDELGRATSNEDGVAIAWSVSEHLLANRVMTFFVTHYPQLSKLSLVYPAVQNQHMGSIVSGEGPVELCYTHKIRSGPCQTSSDYAVEMATTCGWPSAVVKEARKIRSEVESKMPDGALCLVDGIGDDEEMGQPAHELLHVIAQRLEKIGSNCDPDSFLLQEVLKALEDVRVSCIPSKESEVARAMERILMQDFSQTQKPDAKNASDTSSQTDSTHPGSGNVVTQGFSESLELGKQKRGTYQSSSGDSTSSLSSCDSDTSGSDDSSSSDDDSTSSSSSSESDAPQEP